MIITSQVNYWSDSLGFHQMDNRKIAQVEPMTETPEVQAARAAHQRAWDAAAKAAKENPDPMSDIYNANANKLDEEQSEIDQAMEIISGVSNQKQGLTRYPSLEYNNNQIKSDNLVDRDTVIVAAAESHKISQYERIRRENEDGTVEDEEQPQGEPRGFFYNIDYPVELLVESAESSAARNNLKQAKNFVPKKVTTRLSVDPQLDAESAQFKIVPIRILDAKKYKRSDRGGRRRKASAQSINEEKMVVTRSATEDVANKNAKEDTPIEQVKIDKPTESNSKKQIPVAVKVENMTTLSLEDEPKDASGTSEIIKIKSIAEQEQELKSLATNADLIDAVHDAQIHPKQI